MKAAHFPSSASRSLAVGLTGRSVTRNEAETRTWLKRQARRAERRGANAELLQADLHDFPVLRVVQEEAPMVDAAPAVSLEELFELQREGVIGAFPQGIAKPVHVTHKRSRTPVYASH